MKKVIAASILALFGIVSVSANAAPMYMNPPPPNQPPPPHHHKPHHHHHHHHHHHRMF